MTQSVFTLNLERCTGCAACAIACTNENDVGEGLSWRQIRTFNPERHPSAGTFHFSLACNHCAEPACLYGCPTRAYSKHPQTGAVLLDPERCIGCGYCAWVCPYDAPQYNPSAGVMEKCTFCSHRLEESLEPACVEACPVEALGFVSAAEPGTPPVAGFPETGLRPGIHLEPGRYARTLPSEATDRRGRFDLRRLRGEWPLLAFSLVATWMVALFAAAWIVSADVPRWLFPLTGAVAVGVSTLHLGRPLRAWRAIASLGTSWVSREVVGFSLFWLLASIACLDPSVPRAVGGVAMLVGFGTLVAMDLVYRVPGQTVPAVPHSAMTVLTGVFLLGLMIRQPWVAAGAGALKLVLWPWSGAPSASWTVVRVGTGLVWPALVGWARPDATAMLLLAGPVVGETLDRIRFYAELEFLTPSLQIARDQPPPNAHERPTPRTATLAPLPHRR